MYFCKQNNKHDGRTGEKRNNIPSHIIYNKGMVMNMPGRVKD